MTTMDIKTLKKICKDTDLYSTPEQNDKIYQHYKGFKKIENLDLYTGLKVVYLEGNALSELSGLEKCIEQRSIYAQENLIETLVGLDTLVNLDTLNVSNNALTSVSGLETVKSLTSLLLSRNRISKISSLAACVELDKQTVQDISHNLLDGTMDEMVTFLQSLPNLRVLYLKGNNIVDKIDNYRKTLINACSQLTYLDDRPVFDDERRYALAWKEGGLDKEREVRGMIAKEEEDKHLQHMLAFEELLGKKNVNSYMSNSDNSNDDMKEDHTTDSEEEGVDPSYEGSQTVRDVSKAIRRRQKLEFDNNSSNSTSIGGSTTKKSSLIEMIDDDGDENDQTFLTNVSGNSDQSGKKDNIKIVQENTVQPTIPTNTTTTNRKKILIEVVEDMNALD